MRLVFMPFCWQVDEFCFVVYNSVDLAVFNEFVCVPTSGSTLRGQRIQQFVATARKSYRTASLQQI